MGKLSNKLEEIKEYVRLKLWDEGIDHAVGVDGDDTMEGFQKLFKAKKKNRSNNQHRMRSLYSYDIRDNRKFMKIQKIEKRIRKIYGM